VPMTTDSSPRTLRSSTSSSRRKTESTSARKTWARPQRETQTIQETAIETESDMSPDPSGRPDRGPTRRGPVSEAALSGRECEPAQPGDVPGCALAPYEGPVSSRAMECLLATEQPCLLQIMILYNGTSASGSLGSVHMESPTLIEGAALTDETFGQSVLSRAASTASRGRGPTRVWSPQPPGTAAADRAEGRRVPHALRYCSATFGFRAWGSDDLGIDAYGGWRPRRRQLTGRSASAWQQTLPEISRR